MTSQNKAEPFRVTGPGKYRDAGGGIATVTERNDSIAPFSQWLGIDSEGSDATWGDDGRWLSNSHLSLIARIDDAPAEEMAGIGFTEIEVRSDDVIYGLQHWYRERSYLKGGKTYIDWSKVPLSALVKPEPKTETRKVRFAVLRNGGLTQWTGPFPNDTTSPNIIAFIEREIEFTHGEGLVQDLPS